MSCNEKLGLEVKNGMHVYWPQSQYLETLHLSEHTPKTYSVNFNVCAWVTEDGRVFVGPYCPALKEMLVKENYTKDTFDVPFSDWHYPCELHKEWDALWANAEW